MFGTPSFRFPFACLLGMVCCAGVRSPVAALAQSPPSETSRDVEDSHAIDPALTLARESLLYLRDNVADYTAVLTKRCRVDGELSDHQQAIVKIRNRQLEEGRVKVPLSVYMRFRRPAAVNGREIIWVEGRNNGKLVAHDVGIKGLIRVSLDPDGPIAMRGQRYPIREIGLDNLLAKMIETAECDRQRGDCLVKISDQAKVSGRPCRLVQIEHPERQPHFGFYRAQVFFDQELRLPCRYASWSWPIEPEGEPVLEEEYTYTNVRLNVGLTDLDFDPDNPAYDF